MLIATVIGIFAYSQFDGALRDWFRDKELNARAPTPSQTQPAAFPAPPATKPPGLDATEAKAPIPLVLAAVQPGRNAREGIASIGTSKESAQMFPTGALLANGSRLAEVYADHVVLEQRAGRVALYLDGRDAQVLSSAAQASVRQGIEQKVLYVGGPQSRPAEIKAAPENSLAAVVRTQPRFVEGRIAGLQLVEGSDPRLFGALGFKAGDLIIAIDGARVENARQAEDLLGALSSSGPVALTIDRDGHLEYLNVDVEASRRSAASVPPAPVDAPPPPGGSVSL